MGPERSTGVTGGENSEVAVHGAALALAVSPALKPRGGLLEALDAESAMIGEMIRLLLNANGIRTVDRTKIGATPVVRKAAHLRRGRYLR